MDELQQLADAADKQHLHKEAEIIRKAISRISYLEYKLDAANNGMKYWYNIKADNGKLREQLAASQAAFEKEHARAEEALKLLSLEKAKDRNTYHAFKELYQLEKEKVVSLTAECERLRVGNHMLQKRVLELSENEAVASANFKDAQRVIVELSNRLKDVTNQARTNHVTPPKEAE